MRHKNLLLVEGRDDQYVLHHLLAVHRIASAIADRPHPAIPITDRTIIIEQKDGFENLRDEVERALVSSELERFGIIVDADLDIARRWASLQHAFRASSIHGLPAVPEPAGTVFPVAQPDRTLTVGVWIMPDNVHPGMLEDFIKLIRPQDDTLWQRAEHCLAQIPAHERRFRVADERKAVLHTWLAWQEEPGKPLGQAIKARYLDAHAPYAQQLVGWLRRLFTA